MLVKEERYINAINNCYHISLKGETMSFNPLVRL